MSKTNYLKSLLIILTALFVFICASSRSSKLLAAASSSVAMVERDKLGDKENELDNNITGLIMFPTAFKQDKSTGPCLDFSLTNVIGEITGSRAGSDKREYTNPILMSLVSITGKWALLKEQRTTPAAAAGVLYSLAIDLGNKINSEYDYKDITRPATAYGAFASFGKTLINDNTRVTLGYMFGNYSRLFANMATYYYPVNAGIIFTGIDLNFNKFKMYLEIAKPLATEQSPILINFRIKNLVPTLVFSYITAGDYVETGDHIYKGGSSLLASIHLRIPLYPPYSDEELSEIKLKQEEKERYREWQRKVKEIKLN